MTATVPHRKMTFIWNVFKSYLPRIRSERTAFDLHYPHIVERAAPKPTPGTAGTAHDRGTAADREIWPDSDPRRR